MLPTLQAAEPAAMPIPAEAFFKWPAVDQVRLSPSGRYVALRAELQGRFGVFVVDLQADEIKPAPAAIFRDVDVRTFWWLDDERLVFDSVDYQKGQGRDYTDGHGLYAVRHDGTELTVLIDRRQRAYESLAGSLPHANHHLMHVPVPPESGKGRMADRVIVGELKGPGFEITEVVPMWLNTQTGRLGTFNAGAYPDGAIRWWFSPAGRPRAVLSRQEGQDALHWYQAPRDGQEARWVKLAEGPRGELPFQPVWVGQGDMLYVTFSSGPAGEQVLARFDFATGKPGAPWVVTPGFDFAGQVLGDRQGSQVLGVRVDTDTEQTVWVDPVRKALQTAVDADLPGRVNRIDCRRCDADDAVVLVHSWSDRDPGRVLLRLPAGPDGKQRWRLIGEQQPGIEPARMATVDLVRVTARDGRRIPVWVTRPAGTSPGSPFPAVVLVHGGPWVRGGHWRWQPMAQFLASRGYVVIEPEFRGSAGFGAEHERAGDKQFGQAMQDDVTDALRWAQAQKIASDKACIAGGSYGGYSTLMGLIRTPDVFRCGSAWFAMADLLLYVEGNAFITDDLSEGGRKHVIPMRVGDPQRDRAMLLAHSPVEQAHRIRMPLQLVWGSEDLRVPISHGRRLRAAMRAAGQEPEWIEYEGEAHGLRKTENRVDMALKLEAFLARHLK